MVGIWLTLVLGCWVGGVLLRFASAARCLASAARCLLWSLNVCVFLVFSLLLVLCDLVSVKLCLAALRIVCKLLSS